MTSFKRIIGELIIKLPRKEDRELLEKLAEEYEKGGAERVKETLETILENIEGQ